MKDPSQKSGQKVTKTTGTGTYDCYSANRPFRASDGSVYCPQSKPYMSRTKNNYDCCYVKPKFDSTKKLQHQLNEKHEQQLKRLINKGFIRRPSYLKDVGDKKISKSIYSPQNLQKLFGVVHYKIIVYDLETSGLPYGKNYPDITQIAMYAPSSNGSGMTNETIPSGEFYVSYVNPTKVVSPEASVVTNLYNTFEDLGGYYHGQGVDRKWVNRNPFMNSEIYLAEQKVLFPSLFYHRQKLLDQLPLNCPDYAQKANHIKTRAHEELHQRTTKKVIEKHGTKNLDSEPTFEEITDEIRDFIIKDTTADTIILMIAHNGDKFDEPVLRDQFKKAKRDYYLTDNIIFVDSYLLALLWIAEHQTENYKLGTLYKKFLGEDMPGWHDAKADVTGLWKMIEGLFREVWKRDDQTFIAMKFLEFAFSSQLIDENYLRQVAEETFRSREFEDLYEEPQKTSHGKYIEAPFG